MPLTFWFNIIIVRTIPSLSLFIICQNFHHYPILYVERNPFSLTFDANCQPPPASPFTPQIIIIQKCVFSGASTSKIKLTFKLPSTYCLILYNNTYIFWTTLIFANPKHIALSLLFAIDAVGRHSWNMMSMYGKCLNVKKSHR